MRRSALAYMLSRRLARKPGSTVATGSVIAVLGVAFAVAVMELTLAVSVGFKSEIRSRLEGFVPSVTISPANGETSLEVDEPVLEPIRSAAADAEIVTSVAASAMLKSDSNYVALQIRGYQPDYAAGFERSAIIDGQWPSGDKKWEIMLSKTTAKALGLSLGERINACFVTDAGIRVRPYTVAAIYDTGFAEYDAAVAYAPAAGLRGVLSLRPTEASVIEVRGVPVEASDSVGQAIAAEYTRNASFGVQYANSAFAVDTIARRGAVYLSWLDLLDANVIAIFVLMALVAFSTLVSSLFIQVLDKVNAIGLLRALGAPGSLVGRIFVYLSMRLVGWGLLVGNVLGIGLIFVQSVWHPIGLDPEMYYLSSVPVSINAMQIALINLGVVVTSWLVLLLPARIATRLSPASTLRFD